MSSFGSVVESLLVVSFLTPLHYILYKSTGKTLRPKVPFLLGLDKLNDVQRINTDLGKLNFPPINSPVGIKDHPNEDINIDTYKLALFDISISTSLHLIILTILNSTSIFSTNAIFKLDYHLTVNVLVLCVLYLTPMLFIWNQLTVNKPIEKITMLSLYCLGTFISSFVIVRAVFKLKSPNLTQLGVHVIDIIGISSIAIINLYTCWSGMFRFYQWYFNKDPVLYEEKSIALIDILSDPNGQDLFHVSRLVRDLNSYKKGKKSLITKIYWVYCFIRGFMWIITILSILNISLTTLSSHKRDQKTIEILTYFLSIDESFIDVLVSLISLVMNMMSTYQLIKLGDHMVILGLICSLSTLLAIT